MPKARIDLLLDCADPEALAGFWRDALGYREYVAWDECAILVPKDDIGPPLVLQKVPEPKSVKNRMHIDLVHDDVESEVARLVGLGAKRLHDGIRNFGDVRWVAMSDPEDNEFCVCTGVEW